MLILGLSDTIAQIIQAYTKSQAAGAPQPPRSFKITAKADFDQPGARQQTKVAAVNQSSCGQELATSLRFKKAIRSRNAG